MFTAGTEINQSALVTYPYNQTVGNIEWSRFQEFSVITDIHMLDLTEYDTYWIYQENEYDKVLC